MDESQKRVGWRRLLKNVGRVPSDLAKPIRKWRKRRKLLRIEPLSDHQGTDQVMLFLSPEALLGPHQANMAFLARTMLDRGHRVLMTRCHDLFARCPAMSAAGLDFDAAEQERQATCLHCTQIARSFADHFQVPSLDLRALDGESLRRAVREAMDGAPKDLTEFEFDGVPFGKLSTVDLVLKTKIHELRQVSGDVRSKWLQLIESSLKMYLLVNALADKIPLHSVIHHNDYSFLLGGRIAAEKRGIAVRAVTLAYHTNIAQGKIVIYPTYWPIYHKQVADDWSEWREQPIPAAQVREVVDDLIVRTSGSGSHIYSAARSNAEDAVRAVGLQPGKRLLVAYTSSFDELVASRMLVDAVGKSQPETKQPFVDQIDWLTQLVRFVSSRDDLQLVVRVHPREGANHRESTESEHLPMLKRAFAELPDNCRFVWPGEAVSSYDLGEAADLALTSWSTIGIEMARFGVPLLAAFQLAEAPYPVDDFIRWTSDADRYFQRLEQLLESTPRWDTWRRAIRWYHLANLAVSVDVADAVEPLQQGRPSPYRAPAAAEAIESLLLGKQVVHRHTLDQIRQQTHDRMEAVETNELQTQLQRLIHYLATGRDLQAAPAGIQEAAKADNQAERAATKTERPIQWTARNSNVAYRFQNHEGSEQELNVWSPMLARLIGMEEQIAEHSDGSWKKSA